MPEQKLFTYADLESFPEDGLRREIIDGELIVSASPFLRHQRISGRFHLIFGNHLAELGGGEVFYAPCDVVFSDINVVEPDLLFISDARLEIMTEKNIQGAPSLVIEILSSKPRLDRVRKRELYGRFGVPEYWIVDGEADRVEVYRHDGTGYGKPEIFEPGEQLTYSALPGLSIDLTALFAE